MPLRTPLYVFRNLDGKQFEELMEEAGSDVAMPRIGRGCAFGDFDNDGDADILLAAVDEPPLSVARTHNQLHPPVVVAVDERHPNAHVLHEVVEVPWRLRKSRACAIRPLPPHSRT